MQTTSDLPSGPGEAFRLGVKLYFTGKPCVAGHLSPRYESSRVCVDCLKDHNKKSNWRARNPVSVARITAAYKPRLAHLTRERRKDPVVRFKAVTRGLINTSFSRKRMKKSARTEALLGCSMMEFRAHIERQFLPGMTWENRGLWHIDHIVPLASAVTIADVAALCRCSNLRPLWAEDNREKRAKQTHLI